MSIIFPSEQAKPSNLEGLPNQFVRPSFEELYGFDAITDALLTEAGEIIQTEASETLQFDEDSPIAPGVNTYTNSDNTLRVTITGSIAVFNWDAVADAVNYNPALYTLTAPSFGVDNTVLAPTTTVTVDLSAVGYNSGQFIHARLIIFKTDSSFSISPTISNITF